MSFILTNPNPKGNLTGDCVIRAICIAEGRDWDDVYLDLMAKGFMEKDMIESNVLWSSYLHSLGYTRHIIPDTCPDCYTVSDFTRDYPVGTYILGTGSHVICVKNGNHYDTWDSSAKVPIFYWEKER